MTETSRPLPEDPAVETLRQFLGDLMDHLEPTARIEIERQDRKLHVHLAQTSAFADHEGASIQALEHLSDLHLRRNLREEARVHLDIDGFRQRRTEELQALAGTLAEQAQSDNSAVRLEPMPAWERKTVHEALEHIEGVRTYSQGNLERRVVIEPLNATKRR